jgi:tetratricopeptide (TPR) repeat protein
MLSGSQRYGDAVGQLEAVTRNEPKLAAPWITLGALHLELRQPKQAIAALERYVELAQADDGKEADPHGAVDDEEAVAAAAPDRGLTQAWLMLAQAAEQQGDFKAAEAWLEKVDSPQRALEVLSRRASLMARQGKLPEARELIRRAPERTEEDGRAKLLAEVGILRDSKSWGEASKVLSSANQKYPDDIDLLYEQSMMAEKLNRLEEMERLLRRVIELKPDHHHAHNALGYSLAERNLRLPEAKALIQKALEIAPGEPFITDSLGWVEYRMGNRDEALRLLRGAYQSRPDPEIAAHLGEVLWVTGQREEARRVWREGRSKDSANDVLRETLARLRVGDL